MSDSFWSTVSDGAATIVAGTYWLIITGGCALLFPAFLLLWVIGRLTR